ncbi:MAG: acetyl-CoA carboxylase biotin carboxylase subunit [Deltaproteobacteria bacterium]|nr:acetyl-CoA carboxylase biotin carboxylase subunit [Deltaproteobacteria bacterium]
MFKKILIANRGEIAVRVIRACHELDIEAVAVYSEADRKALHVRYADEAYCIGPAPSPQSYLRTDKILEVAKKSKAEAVHPGYGFLAENPRFARECEDAGFVFIGPSSKTIEQMGSKVRARQTMIAAKVPVVPGTEDPLRDLEHAKEIAEEIGYPIFLKAAMGGGGKGMRIVRDPNQLAAALRGAQSEAKSAFGDDSVYIERALEKPRHIEFQILADNHGEIVHLFERECSIQRRHQKVIEETPSTFLDPMMRQKMGEIAKQAAKAAGYRNAGTIEFLVDQHRNFYFLEMNTRIQVEHPITERVVGVDLVKAQIEIAAGRSLPFKQQNLVQTGHAIECRICAEDPANQFLPSAGLIKGLRTPGGFGVREDTGIFEGWEIPVFYDPLLSKLVAWGEDRTDAIRRMTRCLEEYQLLGVKTNIPFHLWVMRNDYFLQGDYDTHFIDTHFSKENLIQSSHHKEVAWIGAALEAWHRDQKRLRMMLSAPGGGSADSPWKLQGRREALGLD